MLTYLRKFNRNQNRPNRADNGYDRERINIYCARNNRSRSRVDELPEASEAAQNSSLGEKERTVRRCCDAEEAWKKLWAAKLRGRASKLLD